MRVARALWKKNLLGKKVSLESAAKVIEEVSNLPLMLDVLSSMDGAEVIERVTSAAAKRACTF